MIAVAYVIGRISIDRFSGNDYDNEQYKDEEEIPIPDGEIQESNSPRRDSRPQPYWKALLDKFSATFKLYYSYIYLRARTKDQDESL